MIDSRSHQTIRNNFRRVIRFGELRWCINFGAVSRTQGNQENSKENKSRTDWKQKGPPFPPAPPGFLDTYHQTFSCANSNVLLPHNLSFHMTAICKVPSSLPSFTMMVNSIQYTFFRGRSGSLPFSHSARSTSAMLKEMVPTWSTTYVLSAHLLSFQHLFIQREWTHCSSFSTEPCSTCRSISSACHLWLYEGNNGEYIGFPFSCRAIFHRSKCRI